MSQLLIQFMEVLQLVALEPAEQEAVLPSFVDVPDEVVILFGDHLDAVPRAVLEAAFVGASKALLEQLQEIFREMDARPEFYSRSAFEEFPQWQMSRQIARAILRELGIPRHRPVLDWLSYVRG